MSIIQKVNSGLAYYDNFQSGFLNPLWSVFPTDPTRYTTTELTGAFRLKAEPTPTYAFLSSLTDNTDFTLEIRNSYVPINPGGQSGIIVYTNDDDSISLDQYYDSTAHVVYPYLRLTRKNNFYEAFASQDGQLWELIGSQYYWNNSPLIGVYIYSALSASTPVTPLDDQSLDLYEVKIFNGTKLRISNLVPGMKVELVDTVGTRLAWGVCLESDTYADIDVSSLPIPFQAGINIYSTDGTKMSSNITDPLTFWGGDEYKFSISPDIYYLEDAQLDQTITLPLPATPLPVMDRLEENTETYLGYVNGGTDAYSFRRLLVKNNQQGSFRNLIVSLQEYNNTNDYSTMCGVALEDPSNPGYPLPFSGSVSIPQLDSGDSVLLRLKISRDLTGIPKDSAYFRVQIESTFSY